MKVYVNERHLLLVLVAMVTMLWLAYWVQKGQNIAFLRITPKLLHGFASNLVFRWILTRQTYWQFLFLWQHWSQWNIVCRKVTKHIFDHNLKNPWPICLKFGMVIVASLFHNLDVLVAMVIMIWMEFLVQESHKTHFWA